MDRNTEDPVRCGRVLLCICLEDLFSVGALQTGEFMCLKAVVSRICEQKVNGIFNGSITFLLRRIVLDRFVGIFRFFCPVKFEQECPALKSVRVDFRYFPLRRILKATLN